MLINLLHTIADLVVLVTRLRVEDLADEQRMALIDQSILLQGFGAAFEFDLHELLMILITILIIICWRAWKRVGRGHIADSNRGMLPNASGLSMRSSL